MAYDFDGFFFSFISAGISFLIIISIGFIATRTSFIYIRGECYCVIRRGNSVSDRACGDAQQIYTTILDTFNFCLFFFLHFVHSTNISFFFRFEHCFFRISLRMMIFIFHRCAVYVTFFFRTFELSLDVGQQFSSFQPFRFRLSFRL